MKPGDRVEVRAGWSSLFGLRGTVKQTRPYLTVVFPDDPRPLRVGENEVVVLEEVKHIGGAE